jgi:predicted DCC family thiol-disulfide oxidoreductase YuxK
MRIGVGLIMIADILIRWPDVAWFMSDYGAYSVQASKAATSEYRFSLYWIFDSLIWVHVLFAAHLLVGFLLAIGSRTRLMTFAAFVLIASLHNRNPVLLQGGDNLLLLLTFWALFLPWGERYSLDSVATQTPAVKQEYFGVGSIALLIQIMSVYFFSAFLKNGIEWTSDGTAIYYALHIDQVAHLLAPYWRDWHWLTIPLTHYVWWLELLGPIVALSPIFNNYARALAAFCFITLEIGFLFNLNVGLFPFVSITSLLILVPGVAWDWVERVFRAKMHPKMTMYYDQDCGFCLKTCLLIKAVFGLNAVVKPAQSVQEVGEILEREFTWVLEIDGERWIRWQALVECIRRGGRFRFVASWLAKLGASGDRAYNFIGHNRNQFGVITQLVMPWRSQAFLPGRLSQTLATLFLLVVCVHNVSSVPKSERSSTFLALFEANDRLQGGLVPIIELARLDQWWNMFAPYPQKNDGWFLMVGLTSSGALVDVLAQVKSPPSTEKPAHFVPDQAANYRWRKYLSRIMQPGYKDELAYYAGAACVRWNSRESALANGADQLEAFNIYFVQERTPEIGESIPIKYLLRWRHDCFDTSRLAEDRVQNAMLASGSP